MRWTLIATLVLLTALGLGVSLSSDDARAPRHSPRQDDGATNTEPVDIRGEGPKPKGNVNQPRLNSTRIEPTPTVAQTEVAANRARIAPPPEDAFLTDWLRRKKQLEVPILDRVRFGTASAGEVMRFNRDASKLMRELVQAKGQRSAEKILNDHPLMRIDERTGALAKMKIRAS